MNIPQSVIEAATSVLNKTINEQFAPDSVGKIYLEHAMTQREVAGANQRYVSLIPKHKEVAAEISKHVIPVGQDRITIPLTNTDHPTKQAVEHHLLSKGFHGVDYGAGHVYDSYDRKVKIGKALNQSGADKELIDQYATHQPTYKPSGNENYEVVISRHPHDVIGMSQGTGWGLRPGEEHLPGEDQHPQSCMRMGTSQHDTHIVHELLNGTHVAWLVNKGDHEAKDPVARVTLKPYTNESDVYHNGATITIPHTSKEYKEMVSDSREMGFEGSDEDAFESAINIHTNMNIGTLDDADMSGQPHSVVEALRHAKGVDVTHVKHEYGLSRVHVKFDNPIASVHSQAIARNATPFRGMISWVPHKMEQLDSHTILRRGKVYGKNVDAFTNTVDKFTDTHFAKKSDVYVAPDGIYLDGNPSHV